MCVRVLACVVTGWHPWRLGDKWSVVVSQSSKTWVKYVKDVLPLLAVLQGKDFQVMFFGRSS